MQPTAEEKQNDLSLCCNKVERVLIAKLSKDIFSIKMFLLMNVGDQTQQLTPLGQCNTNLSGTTQLQTGTYQTQHSYRQEPIRHHTATDRNLSGTTQLQTGTYQAQHSYRQEPIRHHTATDRNLSDTTQLQTGTYQTQHSYRQEPIRHNTATDRNLSGTTQLQTGTYQTQHSYRQEPIRHNIATDRNLSDTTQLQTGTYQTQHSYRQEPIRHNTATVYLSLGHFWSVMQHKDNVYCNDWCRCSHCSSTCNFYSEQRATRQHNEYTLTRRWNGCLK